MNARSFLAQACTTLLAVSPICLGAESTKPVDRRLPRTLMGSWKRTTTGIFWRNGEKANGEIFAADEKTLDWKSPIFETPIPLPHTAIERVDFSGGSAKLSGKFRFAFVDGSHLTGNLKSIEAGVATLSDTLGGEIQVRLEELVAIDRISGEGIVAASPASLLIGESTSNSQQKTNPPFIGTRGEVAIVEFNGAIRQNLELPEKCLVKLRLRIEREPQFALDLSTIGKAVTLATWGDELVLSIGENFVSAGKVPIADDGRLELQLAWDRKTGTAIVYDKLSNAIAELGSDKKEEEKKPAARPKKSFLGAIPLIGKDLQRLVGEEPARVVAAPEPKAKRGLTLTNRGAGFVVEQYSVTSWSGETPVAMRRAVTGLETQNEFIGGEVQAFDGQNLTVVTETGERLIPVGEARSVSWDRPEKVGPEIPRTQLWYFTGNLLRGNLLEIKEGRARLSTSFSDEAVSATLENSRALILPLPATSPDKKPRPLKEMDTIAVGNLVLRGAIHPGGGILPEFVPTGSEKALALSPKTDLVLRKHLARDAKHTRAEALLNTRDEESLPVVIKHIKEKEVGFHWEASEVKKTDVANLSSIQFPEPAMSFEQGFGSAGWKTLGKRKKKKSEKAAKGEITLDPGMGLGHANILHGVDFGFSFRKKDHNNVSFRVRLFCHGTREKANSTNFLVAHYGSIYAGLERGETGQFASNRSDFSGINDDEIKVTFKFTKTKVEMRINNQVAGSAKLQDQKGKSGSGLIIEPASLWGNSMGQLVVSDFTMRGAPLGVTPPSFDEDAKREALLLPRLRRDVPPRHILIGRNGDLLRGEIESKSDSHVQFRVGLETYQVPIERVGAAVWVAEADKTMNNVKKKPAAAKPAEEKTKKVTKKDDAPEKDEKTVDHAQQWLDLTSGGHLKLQVESWNEKHVIGTHKILGRCKIPTEQVHRVSLKKPLVGGALAALANWKFKHTVDPNPPGQEEVDVSPLVGKPAPDFSLKMLDGKTFKLSKAKGKVVVLDFWATWCAPCVRSLPSVIDAMDKFPEDKVSFITVNQGEAKKQIERFLEIREFDMPVGFDPEMKTGDQFGVESIPFTVVIDGDGTVTYVSLGASSDGAQKLSDAVTKALAKGDSE